MQICRRDTLREDVLIWWNFVARSQDEFAEAAKDWNDGARFGQVVGATAPQIPAPDPSGLRLRPSQG
jgi:hypothetical protein